MSFFGLNKLHPNYNTEQRRRDRIHAVLNKIGVDHPKYDDCVLCLLPDSKKEPMIMPDGTITMVTLRPMFY